MRRRLIAILLAISVLGAACSDGGNAEPQILAGEVWSFDNESINLSELSGQPLVINFFAESCAPCVAEMPMFQMVADSLAGEVAFVGVSEDPNAGAAEGILELTGVTYPTWWDRDGSALSALGTFGLPSTIFVNSDGTIHEARTGAINEDTLRDFIAQLS